MRRPLMPSHSTLSALGVLLLAACASTDPPAGQVEPEPQEAAAPIAAAATPADPCAPAEDAAGEGPAYTPFTQQPELANQADVVAALEREYTAEMRQRGGSWTAQVWVFVTCEGDVLRRQIKDSSGDDDVDRAALAVVDVMRFAPARNRDAPVPVWIALPVTFRSE